MIGAVEGRQDYKISKDIEGAVRDSRDYK